MSTQTHPHPSYSFGQRLSVLGRCLMNGCPRCGQRPIASLFSFKTTCPGCQLLIDKGNGFLLGALPVSYGIFVLFWLIPLLVAWALKYLSYPMAFGLIAFGAVAWPILLYNYCKMVSLGTYYFFMIKELKEEVNS
ncbi:MAG: hypothetical protein ACAI44_03795 [Candidatus Sericytochromatia bacterium]